MICAITTRRIVAGKADEFIEQFRGQGDEMPAEIREQFQAVYACKDVNDPDVILTFGIFKGNLEELRALQSQDVRAAQLDAIAPIVEETIFDGAFEVIEQLVGAGVAA